MRRSTRTKFIVALIFAFVLITLDLLLGSESISFSELLVSGSFSQEILLDFRLPKLVTAILAGIALSVSGLVMQTVFRNPLAGPYMLGVSAGASFGVALFMLATPLVNISFLKFFGMAASAWIGSAVVLVVILAVSIKMRDIMAVLILGMMIGSAVSAFVDVLQFFSNESALKGFVLWSMGSFGGLSTLQLSIMLSSVVLGLCITLPMIKTLDVMLLGDNYATTMGVDITRSRTILFVATALLAGGVTAFCGPVAFIGIAAPHIARMIWHNAAHRILLPASLLSGVVMMLLCDILSSVPLFGYPLPLNTVTAMFGIPVVVIVVWKGNRAEKIM